jgi:hypothetical protein
MERRRILVCQVVGWKEGKTIQTRHQYDITGKVLVLYTNTPDQFLPQMLLQITCTEVSQVARCGACSQRYLKLITAEQAHRGLSSCSLRSMRIKLSQVDHCRTSSQRSLKLITAEQAHRGLSSFTRTEHAHRRTPWPESASELY